MSGIGQAFIDALGRLELHGDVAEIAGLFAADATISNPLVEHRAGEGGADGFWRNYRDTFDTIRSEFRHVVEQDAVLFLEWISNGTIDGRSIRYGGVSVLETSLPGIVRFRAYFDPAFLQPGPRGAR